MNTLDWRQTPTGALIAYLEEPPEECREDHCAHGFHPQYALVPEVRENQKSREWVRRTWEVWEKETRYDRNVIGKNLSIQDAINLAESQAAARAGTAGTGTAGTGTIQLGPAGPRREPDPRGCPSRNPGRPAGPGARMQAGTPDNHP